MGVVERPGTAVDPAEAQRLEDRAVEPVQTRPVDLVEVQRVAGHLERADPVCPHLRVVADPPQQPVGDPWSPAAA